MPLLTYGSARQLCDVNQEVWQQQGGRAGYKRTIFGETHASLKGAACLKARTAGEGSLLGNSTLKELVPT
jgi:hypothetical protein